MLESRSSGWVQGFGSSDAVSVSGDGRHLAFVSAANNLTAGDTNGFADVFLRDRLFGVTQRVSQSTAGAAGNSTSSAPSISANGRFVVFESTATSLVSNDTNNRKDIFVRDTLTPSTTRVSVSTSGTPSNQDSSDADISGDGRYVVFASAATNLVAGDTNGKTDVFVHDRNTATTTRISVDALAQESNGHCFTPKISDDGNWVCFTSDATNLVAGDVNGQRDVFLYDIQTGTLVSVTMNPGNLIANGPSEQPDISATGDFVVLSSAATNLSAGDTNGVVDIFRWRRSNGAFQRVSVDSFGAPACCASSFGSVSSDGRLVTFTSLAALTTNDSNAHADVFVRDVIAGVTTLVSVATTNASGNGTSARSTISADGEMIGFASVATNLVSIDLNGASDVFLRGDRCTGATTYCNAKANSNACVPLICSAGTPTLAGADDFHVTAFSVLNLKSGMFFWGLAPSATPYKGGTLCVIPVSRTPIQDSGGNTTTNDCSGTYRYHFSHVYMQTWGLTPGTHCYGQFWSRDPFFTPPNNIGLTNAVEFVIAP